MKNIIICIICIICIIFGIVFIGCDNGQNNSQNNSDEYYIKYVVNSSSIYITTRYVQIVNENNSNLNFSFGSSSWETVIGPVKYGFNAKIKASFNSDFTNSSLGNSNIGTEIYVSKNNGPFALKKITGVQGTNVEANYKIDF